MTTNAIIRGNAVLGPLMEGMVEYGWHVHLFTDPGSTAQEDLPAGVVLHPIGLPRAVSPAADLRALLKWNQAMRAIRPQVVVGNSPKGGLIGMLAALAARVPTRVYWLRGAKWDGMEGVGGWALRRLDKIACRASTHRLAVSHSLAAKFESARIADKVVVLGQGGSRGVEVARFAPPSPRRIDDPSRPRLVFVGRISKSKGVDLLPSLMEAVRRDIPECQLYVVGPSDTEDPVSLATMEWLKRESGVHLVGYCPNVAKVLRETDIFVFPTYREGMPNALLEAQAAGLPALGWDVTGVKDVIEPGVTGFLVSPTNIENMASLLVELVREPMLYERMSARATEHIRKHFSRENVQLQVFRWLDSL